MYKKGTDEKLAEKNAVITVEAETAALSGTDYAGSWYGRTVSYTDGSYTDPKSEYAGVRQAELTLSEPSNGKGDFTLHLFELRNYGTETYDIGTVSGTYEAGNKGSSYTFIWFCPASDPSSMLYTSLKAYNSSGEFNLAYYSEGDYMEVSTTGGLLYLMRFTRQ